ncbi:hypothetical protein ACIP5Y_09885 [Nocardia sp. NPDC088792]|uniref:hypothetical protein n=1 Tax=Nocardia sp. NPDC088792 TaxID=3364332 RepID=UPI0038270FA1
MKRIILVGVVGCALLGGAAGTAGAQGIPLTPSDVDVSAGSAEALGNAVGTGSVNIGVPLAGLGAAFGSGYANGVLSTLSAQ